MLPSSGACGGVARLAPPSPDSRTCSRRREHGTPARGRFADDDSPIELLISIPLQGRGSQEKKPDIESILGELRIGELSEEEAEKVRRILNAA
jgi:hypothetical protein